MLLVVGLALLASPALADKSLDEDPDEKRKDREKGPSGDCTKDNSCGKHEGEIKERNEEEGKRKKGGEGKKDSQQQQGKGSG